MFVLINYLDAVLYLKRKLLTLTGMFHKSLFGCVVLCVGLLSFSWIIVVAFYLDKVFCRFCKRSLFVCFTYSWVCFTGKENWMMFPLCYACFMSDINLGLIIIKVFFYFISQAGRELFASLDKESREDDIQAKVCKFLNNNKQYLITGKREGNFYTLKSYIF